MGAVHSADPNTLHRQSSSALRERHKWSLIRGEYDETDTTLDEHQEFIRSVRNFNYELLRQYKPSRRSTQAEWGAERQGAASSDGDSDDSMESYWESDDDQEDGPNAAATASGFLLPRSARSFAAESEEYVARFAQPFPARPMWAALPPDARAGAAGSRGGRPEIAALREKTVSDFDCAPMVCAVLRDSQQAQPAIRQVLNGLACHDAGLLVSERRVENPNLRFVVVGLRALPKTVGANSGKIAPGVPKDDRLVSRADQRQIVWGAVHQVLDEVASSGVLPDRDWIVDTYMLRAVYLYDRLFRWIDQSKTWDWPLRPISQDELDLLVHEFGEETATHFLFVAQYVSHLRVAALVSLVCIIITVLDRFRLSGDPAMMESIKRAFLVAFLPAWGFHFLASWRAVACKAGFRWMGSLGSVQNSLKEIAQAQAMETQWEQKMRYLRVLMLTVPLMVGQMLVVFLTTVAFVCVEVYLYDVVWEILPSWAQILAFLVYNGAFAVAFILMLGVFYPISKAVTNCERHPAEELSEWHLTVKIYGNWFLAVFLYFFVIAFCYIPFGDRIADGIAQMYKDDTNSTGVATSRLLRAQEAYTIHGALQRFRPDLHRLAMDVALFFVLQDLARLFHVLEPVIRAAYGLGKMKGLPGSRRHLHKRAAVLSVAYGMVAFVWCQRFCCKRRKRYVSPRKDCAPCDSGTRRKVVPASGSAPPADGVWVVYCCIEHVEVEGPKLSTVHDAFGMDDFKLPKHEVVSLSLRLASPGAPAVSSRLRACHSDGMTRMLQEHEDDALWDLFTLRVPRHAVPWVRPAGLGGDAKAGGAAFASFGGLAAQDARQLTTVNESEADAGSSEGDEPSEEDGAIDASGFCDCTPSPNRGGSSREHKHTVYAPVNGGGGGGLQVIMRAETIGSSADPPHDGGSWEVPVELPIAIGAPARGEVFVGPVRTTYLAGLVHGATHYEALEKVPRAVRLARSNRPGEEEGQEPDPETAAMEEAWDLEVKDGKLPWLWWDEELASLHWEEVFELYVVKWPFETFELYAHLATQFSYVCLFGIAVPICPLLAWLFTSVEARQDQLRLLWLSRPPHPHKEDMRFKRTVTLGAWYMILKFTCHMSVIVNLLLWMLTYAGLSRRKPADWTSEEWWRAITVFLLCQQACFVLGHALHRSVAQLDHDTAAAYLRRCSRLQHVFKVDEDDLSPTCSRRQADREVTRRRLTRSPSRGLSGLV